MLIQLQMRTVKLLNISLILFVVSMVAALSWTVLGFKNADTPFIALLLIICFGLNVAGVFVGFNEPAKVKKKISVWHHRQSDLCGTLCYVFSLRADHHVKLPWSAVRNLFPYHQRTDTIIREYWRSLVPRAALSVASPRATQKPTLLRAFHCNR
jgi:hypothetical protein